MSENPEIELIDANENPWYVLATVFGEQDGEETDYALDRKNRSVWNAWALSEHSDEAKQAFYSNLPSHFDRSTLDNVENEYLEKHEDWMQCIQAAFDERFSDAREVPKIPSPREIIDLSELYFDIRLSMRGYIFPSITHFSNSRANASVDLFGAVFDTEVYWGKFRAEFSIDFDGALINEVCSFNWVDFSGLLLRKTIFLNHPPLFSDGARLDHIQLTADEAYWPALTSENITVASKTSYIILRRMMAERQDTDMEHFFYRQEMRCIIAENGDNLWKRLPYQAFRLFSDFGHSIARPVQWLVGLWGVMAVLFTAFFHLGRNPTGFGLADGGEPFSLLLFSGGYSAANMFAFLGFRGLYLDDEIAKMSGWVQVLSGAQTMASFALLFFLALALRNRFRLT